MGAQILLLLGVVIIFSPAQPLFYLFQMHSSNINNITLTPMQETAGQAIREGENVVLLSPTGSGKTLAFILPLIDAVEQGRGVQAVVVVPSRELALQIEAVFRDVVRQQQLPLRGMALYGGRPTMDEHRVLREVHPEVIFATPGRLLDHIGKENVDITPTRLLVIDEYDKCLELGFRDEMDSIAREFARCPQVALTSATTTDETALILEHRTWTTLDFIDSDALRNRLSISIVPSPEKDKLETLARLLSHIGTEQCIVFVAHRESAERIGNYLAKEKFAAVVYHGGMEQDRRERALYRYRAGAASVLVSTDLAARGLDIPTVRHIIHYHLPLDEATFTHRTGRTARWDDTGAAYLIVGPEEQVAEFVPEDVETLSVDEVRIHARQPEWTLFYIGRGKKDKLSRADILGFLCKKGGLTARQIGRIDLAAHASYVAIERTAVKALQQRIAGEKIKGMRTIIEPIRH